MKEAYFEVQWAPHPLRQVPSKAWELPSAAEGSTPRTLCPLQPFILEKRSQRPQLASISLCPAQKL